MESEEWAHWSDLSCSTGCSQHPWHVWRTNAGLVLSGNHVPICELEGKDPVCLSMIPSYNWSPTCWDERWVLHVSGESLNSTSETNATLYDNYLEFKLKKISKIKSPGSTFPIVWKIKKKMNKTEAQPFSLSSHFSLERPSLCTRKKKMVAIFHHRTKLLSLTSVSPF